MTEAYDEPGGVNPTFTLLDEVPSLPTWVKQHLTYPKWLGAQRAQNGRIHLQLQAVCEHCSMGGWLRSGGWRRFGRTPAYDELVRAHEELHAYVVALAERLNRADSDEWQPEEVPAPLHEAELAFARACTALLCLAPRHPDRDGSLSTGLDCAPPGVGS